MKSHLKAFLGITLPGMLFSCVFVSTTPTLRLYNLESGAILRVFFDDAYTDHGVLRANLPSGEHLKGEFFIGVRPEESKHYPGKIVPLGEEGAGKKLGEGKGYRDITWSELYGFGGDTPVVPVGSAMLVGNRGTVIQVVFYRFKMKKWMGDGVAKDNRGNVYRVYVGEEEVEQ